MTNGSRHAMCLSVWAISIALTLIALPARAQQSQQHPPAAAPPSAESSSPGKSTAPGSGKPSQTDNSKDQDAKKKNDRMFYVMPNFLTVDNASQVKPLTVKEKFVITARGAFDPYE